MFVGRQEPRKGLAVLLRAWPQIRERTGARLSVVGADPLAVRLLLARERVPADAIDVRGFLSQDELTAELLGAKAMVAPSLGGESFGMVLTRAFACATPVVASDIDGYRAVMTGDVGLTRPAGRSARAGRRRRGPPGRRGSAPLPRRRRPRPRRGALQLGRHRSAPAGRLRAGPRPCAGARRGMKRLQRLLHSPWFRAGVVVPMLGAVVAVLWWRGPDWALVGDTFRLVEWSWILAAIGLNLASVAVAGLRLADGRRAGPSRPAAPVPPDLLGVCDRPARQRRAPRTDR